VGRTEASLTLREKGKATYGMELNFFQEAEGCTFKRRNCSVCERKNKSMAASARGRGRDPGTP